MKLKTSNILILALTAVFAFVSCDDWTDTESLDIKTSSIQEQNPELYAQYVQSLNDYKATDHLVMIATVDNLSTTPSARNQHLTNLPDSVDFICLNNITDVNETTVSEIADVRELGTKVLGLIDFDAIEDQWDAILEEGTSTSASSFNEYCQSEVSSLLSACDNLGLDGVIANFTGYDLNYLTETADIQAETSRQGAFFDAISNWVGSSKTLIIKGSPQNVISKGILSECEYLVVTDHAVQTQEEMSYLVLMAAIDDVPADRFVIGVSTPYTDATGDTIGEMSDGTSSIIGAAQWAVSASDDYTKAGVCVDYAEQDYYNADFIYPNIRKAISILNPTVK